MINVGVIGLGAMGATHLDAYARQRDVRVIAIADQREDRLEGRAKAMGNIEGQAQGHANLSLARMYREGMDLIADPDVELVDICLVTPLHRAFAEAALRAGKHVMIEKPLARTSGDAFALADYAAGCPGIAMPAMCMRFWPGWVWLKQAIDERRFGRVLSAHFRRVASHPGGPFYSDGEACGGALLDLHIHDTDFVLHCFGMPATVFSRGHCSVTTAIDHVVTQYLYDDGPIVTAEGGWAMAPGFGFSMQYTVNFERATAIFDLANTPPLTLVRRGEREPVQIPEGMGYEHEIAYLVNCISSATPPARVTLRDAAVALAIVEAEARSIAAGDICSIELPEPTSA